MVSADDMRYPRVLKLRAGRVEVEFEPDNMLVRHVRLGSHELVRGIYAAVRDVEWGTHPLQLSELETEIEEDQFVVRWLSATPVVEWLGELRGTRLGEISYEVRGAALDSFETMRTGICVLHPSHECQGLSCIVEHADGRKEPARFPIEVAPHQPFYNIRALEHSGPTDSTVRIEFQGDVFEMEDQRNWSDASYKTYCRPLDSPAPYVLKAGSIVEQAVRVSVTIAEEFLPNPLPKYATIAVGECGSEDLFLPKIGTMLSTSAALTACQADRLRAMKFSHIGVAVDLAGAMWPSMIAEAEKLEIPVEVHLRSFDRSEELRRLLCALRDVEIARILLVSDDLGVNREPLVEEIHKVLRNPIPVVATSRQNFTELNRARPRLNGLAGIGFAMNPQVHAFDDRSVLETTEIHGELVTNALRISKGLPVIAAPITLEPQSWRDRPADQRLHSSFGAIWTFASLTSFVGSGAHSLTYFETHGPRGILTDDEGARSPIESFFHFISTLRDCAIHESTSNLRSSIQPLLFCGPNGPLAVVGNLTDGRMDVELFGERIGLGPYEWRSVASRGRS